MASRKTNEQCRTWLRSMAADRDSLDGINAELCLRVIEEQKSQLEKLGIQFNQMRRERDMLREAMNSIRGNDRCENWIYVDGFCEESTIPGETEDW